MSEGVAPPRGGLAAAARRRWRPITLGLLLGGAFLALALWGVPLREVAAAMAQAQLIWLVVPAALFLVQQTLRAWRQALILQGSHPAHRFRTSLSVLCISFMLINLLPARLGEVTRPLLLLEKEEIPMGAGFAMVVVERILDLASMFVMIALVAWLVPVPSHILTVQGVQIDWVGLGRVAAGTAGPALLLALLAVLFLGEPLLRRGEARLPGLGPLGRRIAVPLLRFGHSFVVAMAAVRAPRRMLPILGITVLTWTVSGLMYPALAQAFGIGAFIGFGEGVGVLSITMLGMAVPAAPGFAGTYEAFVRGALALFGVAGASPLQPGGPSADAVAVAFALTMHWWINLVQACTGLFFVAVDRVDLARLLRALGQELSAAPRATGSPP